MKYIAGGSLQQRLDRDGPLDGCEILRIGMQTAKGLAAAHAQGLIHRDVKPSNILLDEGVERALLTDFGLARAENDACLTRSGFHPGTPHYMSPEQVRGEAIDGRSDLFSLGSMLYALCTGQPLRLCCTTPTPSLDIRERDPGETWLKVADGQELFLTYIVSDLNDGSLHTGEVVIDIVGQKKSPER